MTKNALQTELKLQHNNFITYINSLSNTQLEFASPNKWSAAQQVQHIYKSIRPLSIGLRLPVFIIKTIWGKSNRPSKTYQQLVEKYTDKLSLGGTASATFIPKLVHATAVQLWNKKIEKSVKRLLKNLQKFSETEIDTIVLPHPLLGKITLREMMYFTIHHVQQHQSIIQRDLK
jgi:hypothetical protein